MGRKKKDEGDEIAAGDIGERTREEISNKFGDGIIVGARSITELPIEVIKISPKIDYMIGGGICKGTWIGISGKAKLGKTTTGLHMLAKAQQAGMSTYFLNAEGRIKQRDLLGIKGLDVDKLHIIKSTEDNILSAEKFLEILDTILHSQREVAVLVDSYSVLTEESKLLEFGKQTRGQQSQIISNFCARNATLVPIKNHIIIGITHIIANTGGGMSPTMEKTPNALVYQSELRLKTGYAKKWTIGGSDDAEQIGSLVCWDCLCSGLRGPGRKCESRLRYGIGIDEVAEYIDFAIEFGIVKKSGAWFTIFPDDETPAKAQGFEKICDYFNLPENSEALERLKKEVNEYLS